MEHSIHFRAIIEVLGRPKEHVQESLQQYITNLKEDKRYKVLHEDFAEIKKQDGKDQELWAGFAEVECSTAKASDLTLFCLTYMPSLIEILKPTSLTFSEQDFSLFLNDLQGHLHNIDIVAKQVKLENDFLKKNMSALLKNYVVVLLSKANLTSQQLSNLTGVDQDKLEDYLDQLIDEGKIDLKEGMYFRIQSEND